MKGKKTKFWQSLTIPIKQGIFRQSFLGLTLRWAKLYQP